MKLTKKISTLALTVALTVQTLVIPSLAATGDGEVTANYNATILPVKGGADAIATLTFDDGRYASDSQLVPLLQQYGLKASLMLVPYRIEGDYGGGYSSVSDILGYTATGTVSVESHSFSHMYIVPQDSPDYKEGNNTSENIYKEVYGSLDYLNDNFPNEDVLTFAVPGSNYTTDAMDSVMKYFYAARMGTKGSATVWQSLDPEDNAEAGGWYNPYITWLTVKGNSDLLAQKLAYLDTCVNNKGWFIAGSHDIAVEPTGSTQDMSPADAAALFAKIKEYQDAGKLWVATYSEATKYIRERQNSTVTEYATADGLFVKVDMNEETDNGLPLSADVFDMPLTVRVEIPDGWTRVRFRQIQNGQLVENYVSTFSDGTKTFALVDVLPNGVAGYLTDGNADLPTSPVEATVSGAKGGAKGIVSMTFDDGIYDTAVLLNKLFAEYGLSGSLMLVTNKTGTSRGNTKEEWNEIFSKGYLDPQSHSSDHINIEDFPLDEAGLDEEIGGSYRDLLRDFPAFDPLTFAVPSSNYGATQYDVVNNYFYAARSGNCVLNYNSIKGQVQSLDPDVRFDSENGYVLGSWYNPYMVRMQPNQSAYASTNSPEQIVDYLTNKIAKDGGWFISLTHAVAPDESASGADMTESQARTIFSAMQQLQDSGKIWVTTYSEATKYLRERQNSTVTAYETADGMYVDLTMAEETADGLPLPAEVFNTPLTVRIKVPSSWGKLTYTQGAVTKEVACVREEGAKFAYIDLIPNGGVASIVNTGDPTGYIDSLGMKQNVAADDSLTMNLYLPKESKITGVYVGRTELTGAAYSEEMLVYSLGDINVTDINREYNFTLKFHKNTGYSDYVITLSVVSYFESLVNSEDVTREEKQLAFDFLLFARASMVKFAPVGTSADTVKVDAVIAKLVAEGFTSTASSAAPSALATVNNVLTAADMAINEKPYYVFYIKEDFTGTLNIAYTDRTGEHNVTYEIVNGYYHCKNYVIFEVEGVYSLASELTITATGEIGGTAVSAQGNYSMKNYADGVNSEYVNMLYSWVLSANAYVN